METEKFRKNLDALSTRQQIIRYLETRDFGLNLVILWEFLSISATSEVLLVLP